MVMIMILAAIILVLALAALVILFVTDKEPDILWQMEEIRLSQEKLMLKLEAMNAYRDMLREAMLRRDD